MNPYLKSLNKIEFVVTDVCRGRCKRCSEGEHDLCGERILTLLDRHRKKEESFL